MGESPNSKKIDNKSWFDDYVFFDTMVTGEKHRNIGEDGEDYSLSGKTDYCIYAIVCDGIGDNNCCRSAKGARFCCEVAEICVIEFCEKLCSTSEVKTDEEIKKQLDFLEQRIVVLWNERIADDVKKDPFTETGLEKVSKARKEDYLNGKNISTAYGTTFKLICYTDTFWFVFQLGDGTVLTFSDGKHLLEEELIAEQCIGNVTTAMCDINNENIKNIMLVKFGAKPFPDAVFGSTDGIDGPLYRGTEKYIKFHKVLLKLFISEEKDGIIEQVNSYLIKELTCYGNKDDAAIVGIINKTKVLETPAYLVGIINKTKVLEIPAYLDIEKIEQTETVVQKNTVKEE